MQFNSNQFMSCCDFFRLKTINGPNKPKPYFHIKSKSIKRAGKSKYSRGTDISHLSLSLFTAFIFNHINPHLSILQCTNNMNASPLFPKFKHLWSVFIVSQTECGTREVMGSKGYKQLDWLVGDWCSSGRKNGLQQRAKFMLDSNISVLVPVVALEKAGGKDQINAKYDKLSNLICWVKNTRHFQLWK